MNKTNLPNHVGLIVDGNRRWAKGKGLSPLYGHEVGIKQTMPKIISYAFSLGIKEVSVWIFSTENWDRSQQEIDHLMLLFQDFVNDLTLSSKKNKFQVNHVGRKDRLPKDLVLRIKSLEGKTVPYKKRLNICIDYGGKDEISRAMSKLINEQKDLTMVSVDLLNQYIQESNKFKFPPDLIIRTGGAQRTSGFMIWDAAYSEIAFESTYFPDLTTKIFRKWILNYGLRERRFGK